MMALLVTLLLASSTVAELPMVARPAWTRTPTAEDIGRVSPRLEQPPAVVHILMVCRITAAGGLEACSIRSEDPPGLGYGPAALALAPMFQMPDLDLDGRPVAGRTVQIPIVWKTAPE